MTVNFFVSTLATFLFFQPACSQYFDRESVLSDLEFLNQSLEQAHYNLYAYTKKEDFQKNYHAIKESVSRDSFSLLEATSVFQRVISKANTGHAEIDFPIHAYIGYAQNGGTLFPLELALEENEVLVRKNYSDISVIGIGSRLIAINGNKIEGIIKKIYPQLSAERTYLKNAKIEFWSFPRLFWQVFGEQQDFTLELSNDGKLFNLRIKAITVEDYESLRNGEILGTERTLRLIDEIAYLDPGPFGSGQENGEALYRQFIDSAFATIRQREIKTLILDLRNNSGGHNAYSDYLVAYFADKPFKWHSDFTLKSSALLKEQTRKYNDTTDTYFKAILEKADGERYSFRYDDCLPITEDRRFKGNVYTLINRQTYSMAAVTAAMIQDYHFATLVGEETGDLPTLYASQFSFQLPKTGITVKLPKGYIIRPNGNQEVVGVIPDLVIRDHLLDDQDEILSGLLNILEKRDGSIGDKR